MLRFQVTKYFGAVIFAAAVAASAQAIKGSNSSGQQTPSQSHSAPCKYKKLWVDPAGNGSPAGRKFVRNLVDALRKTGAVELVKNKTDAQAVFADQVTFEEESPSHNPNVNCTNSKGGTDCYSDNYHAHADENGAFVTYTGPVSKTYNWQLFDTKTYLLLNSVGTVSVDFKHPERAAKQILGNLGCTVRPATGRPQAK